ncbi:Fc.00g081370.m01.CDS01 [Cosmosporella sp. VM-42]
MDSIISHPETEDLETSTKFDHHGVSGLDNNTTTVRHVEDNPVHQHSNDKDLAEADDDPHVAAFQEGHGSPESLSTSTFIAIFFLGLGVVGPITCGQLMIGSVLTPVSADLGGGHIDWVISGWGIASSVSFAIAGRLSDIFGRRYVILVGQVIAVCGAIVAATARSISALIAGSTLLGLSLGFILVIFSAVPELCPYKYRGIGLAWIEFCLFVPWGAVAALLANLINEHTTWRWIYYVAIIYATVSLVGTAIFYFPPSQGTKSGSVSRRRAFIQLDFFGIGLYTAGLALFLVALAWGGSAGHAWTSASVLAPLVIGLATLIACFAYEAIVADPEHAFFPPHLFGRFREFTVLLMVSFVAGMVYYPNAGLLPEATLFVFTNNPTQLGITLIPNGMGQFFGSTVIPGLLHLTKAPKFFIVFAVFLQTLFTGLYVYGIQDHKGAWMAFQFFGQGCFDWITTCTIVNASLHVRHSDMGLAIGLLGAFRSFGGSVGNAIFQAIKTSCLDKRLGPGIAAAAIRNGYSAANLQILIPAAIGHAAGVPDAFAGVPGVTAALVTATSQAVHDAYVYSFERVFYGTIPFGVIGFIAALFIADAGKFMTNHVSVRMEKNVLGRTGALKD